MGCFLCSGESSVSKKDPKKRIIDRKTNRCETSIHAQNSQGIIFAINLLFKFDELMDFPITMFLDL